MSRQSAGKFARVIVSLALLAALVFHVGPGAVVEQIGTMDLTLVVLAFALLVAESLVRALNWFQLIRAGSPGVPLVAVAYAHFVGGFFGALLPSTLGTDLARSAVVTNRSRIAVESVLATTVLLNLLSLAIVSAAALLACALVFDRPDAPRPTLGVSATVSGVCLLVVVALWARARHSEQPEPGASAGVGASLRRRIAQFRNALVVLPRGRRLAGVTFVAAVSYALRSFGWLALLSAADAGITWIALLTIAPLVTLGAALPISVLGFGGFQAISVWVLAQWGVAPGVALAASLVQSALAVLLHSIGCVTYLAGDRIPVPALSTGDTANERFLG